MNFIYNNSIKAYAAGCIKIFNGEWVKRNYDYSNLKGMDVEIHECGIRNMSQNTIFNIELVILDVQTRGSLSCFIYDKDVGEVVSSELQISKVKG